MTTIESRRATPAKRTKSTTSANGNKPTAAGRSASARTVPSKADPSGDLHIARVTKHDRILRAEAKLRRAGKEIRLAVGGGIADRPDGQIIGLLRNAHATRDALMTGRDETIDAMAQRLGIKRDYLSAHMRVTYLAPDVVRALVEGRYPEGLSPARLLSLCKDLPHDWQLQRAALGLETR